MLKYVQTDFVLALFCIVLAVGFLCTLLYLIYIGVFSRIEVKTRRPPFNEIGVAYKFTRGRYVKCRQLISEVRKLAPSLFSFTVYHEDPQDVSDDSLGYTVGVIIHSNENRIDQNTCQILVQHGYIFTKFPAVDYVVMATFPHTGLLSFIIAVARVYPKLRQYIVERKLCAHPFMEIYTRTEILFIAPLSQQDAFYVPEAVPEYEDSDSEYETEDFSTPCGGRNHSLVPTIMQKSELQLRMLSKGCCCDVVARSRSCDYCRTAL